MKSQLIHKFFAGATVDLVNSKSWTGLTQAYFKWPKSRLLRSDISQNFQCYWLLRAAQVCQQFQKASKVVFHSKFQSETHLCNHIAQCWSRNRPIRLSNDIRLTSTDVSPFDVEGVLSVFSSQLQYLSVESTSDIELDDKLFEMIANFAGKSLEKHVMRSSSWVNWM